MGILGHQRHGHTLVGGLFQGNILVVLAEIVHALGGIHPVDGRIAQVHDGAEYVLGAVPEARRDPALRGDGDVLALVPARIDGGIALFHQHITDGVAGIGIGLLGGFGGGKDGIFEGTHHQHGQKQQGKDLAKSPVSVSIHGQKSHQRQEHEVVDIADGHFGVHINGQNAQHAEGKQGDQRPPTGRSALLAVLGLNNGEDQDRHRHEEEIPVMLLVGEQAHQRGQTLVDRLGDLGLFQQLRRREDLVAGNVQQLDRRKTQKVGRRQRTRNDERLPFQLFRADQTHDLLDPFHSQHRHQHDGGLAQALHTRPEGQNHREAEQNQHGHGGLFPTAQKAAEAEKGGDEVAGVVGAEGEEQLPALDLVDGVAAVGREGDEADQTDEAIRKPGEHGLQHPQVREKNAQCHEDGGDSHGQGGLTHYAVDKRGQHGGGDDVELIAKDPSLGEQGLGLPRLHGVQDIRVHIRAVEAGGEGEIQVADVPEKGGQNTGQDDGHGGDSVLFEKLGVSDRR